MTWQWMSSLSRFRAGAPSDNACQANQQNMTWQYGGTVTVTSYPLEGEVYLGRQPGKEQQIGLGATVVVGQWCSSFYNMLDVTGVAAFIIWVSLNPDWAQQNASGCCRMFLQELGHTLTDEHLTACMQNPSTYSLVWSFHFEYLESSMQDTPKGPHMVHLPERDAKYIILTGNSRCICRVRQKCLHKPCNPQCESSVAKVQMIRVLIWVT